MNLQPSLHSDSRPRLVFSCLFSCFVCCQCSFLCFLFGLVFASCFIDCFFFLAWVTLRFCFLPFSLFFFFTVVFSDFFSLSESRSVKRTFSRVSASPLDDFLCRMDYDTSPLDDPLAFGVSVIFLILATSCDISFSFFPSSFLPFPVSLLVMRTKITVMTKKNVQSSFYVVPIRKLSSAPPHLQPFLLLLLFHPFLRHHHHILSLGRHRLPLLRFLS